MWIDGRIKTLQYLKARSTESLFWLLTTVRESRENVNKTTILWSVYEDAH
jgi:hypothetical protein